MGILIIKMVEKNKPKGDFFRAAANIVGNSYAK